jgi:hypothetical protein
LTTCSKLAPTEATPPVARFRLTWCAFDGLKAPVWRIAGYAQQSDGHMRRIGCLLTFAEGDLEENANCQVIPESFLK